MKKALLVMVITIISKILGFGREIVLSFVLGHQLSLTLI